MRVIDVPPIGQVQIEFLPNGMQQVTLVPEHLLPHQRGTGTWQWKIFLHQ
jgi:hypothetical protein